MQGVSKADKQNFETLSESNFIAVFFTTGKGNRRTADGSGVGSAEGLPEGSCVGLPDGMAVGRAVGGDEGSGDGIALGSHCKWQQGITMREG
jgi:hypothetical protein